MDFFKSKEKVDLEQKLVFIQSEIEKVKMVITEWEAKPESQNKNIVMSHYRAQLSEFDAQYHNVLVALGRDKIV